MQQAIHFCATADGVSLACAVSGAGMPLVKSAHWLTHLSHDWTSPIWRHQHEGLSRYFRLLRYDPRGCGLSDREVADMSLAAWVADLEQVVDSAGLERFVLLGMSQGGPIAIEYAARHPGRVSHLVMYGSYVRGRCHWAGVDDAERESQALADLIRLGWDRSNPAYRQLFSSLFIPDGTKEQIEQFNELQRRSASAATAARIVSVIDRLDVTDTARNLDVPALVMHCEDDARIPFAEGRHLAGQIPGARFVPLAGRNHIMLADEPAWEGFLAELLRFTGAGEATQHGAGSAPSGPGPLPADLTERERAVLALLATGASNAVIAESLHLAPKTVRNYLSRIFDKLAVSSRGEAIVAARRAGLGVARPEP